eukprot:2687306-Prymnesium_polylepis.1
MPPAATLWNGVNVTHHAHVSGTGGPQTLNGSWSEPLNAVTNTLCVLGPGEDERVRCPAQCAATHA